jgi:hypothetical protein
MPIGNIKPTKTFKFQNNQWEKISDYPLMKHFRGIEQECTDLKNFYELLLKIFEKPVFMIHGGFIEGINKDYMIRRSREHIENNVTTPPTIENRLLGLFVIDIDNYEYDSRLNIKQAIDSFIYDELPTAFSQSDYVYQLSSSYGMINNKTFLYNNQENTFYPPPFPQKLKAHLFFIPKELIFNVNLMNWSKAWNNFKNVKIIDPAIYKAAQPIYTMRRICISDDDPLNLTNPDPIEKKDFIQYIYKGQPLLDWKPENIETINQKSNNNIINLNLKKDNNYNFSESIQNIMTSENYHEKIRSTALYLANKNISYKDIKIFLEEFLHIAKQGVNDDKERLQDWQLRFDDIPRAIKSAIKIVDRPTFNNVVNWIKTEENESIQNNFSKKLINFEGVELRKLAKAIDEKTGFGLRAITEDIKKAKIEKQEELKQIAIEIKSKERKSQGIFEIEITNSTYGSATKNICKILAKSNKKPEIYKIGNTLSIIENSMPKTIRQITTKNKLAKDYPKTLIIRDIGNPVGIIRSRVEKDCVFINEKGNEIICPDSILNAIPRMYGINWRPLSGIIEHPFINEKWELIEKNGYDPCTGLYTILHHKLKINLISPKKAYNYLINEVFAEFPFHTDLDRATAIGAFMTAVQRPYVIGDHGFPGFAIVSPKPSSGKTTLAQLLSYSIYNRPAAATGWSDNDEELGKHLLAILREGHSCVLFDNIKKDAAIKSNELAKAMTSGTYSRRKLGSNETEEVPSSVLWIFTGNNITFKGDFSTRILPIRIVPNLERPEFRKFKRKDIGKWAMDNRKKILSAILSLVMVGKNIKPDKFESSARFKEWNTFVRIPLLEISGHDLLDVFSKNDFLDDDITAKSNLLKLLHKTFGDKFFLTKDVINLVQGYHYDAKTSIKFDVKIDNDGTEFKHAIIDAFNEKATTNIKTLGRFILGMKDFILDGLMLIRADGNLGAKWRIVQTENNQIKE